MNGRAMPGNIAQDQLNGRDAHKVLGTHWHYNRFLDYGDALDYEKKLEEFRVGLGKTKQ
jgi:hypothetical protein